MAGCQLKVRGGQFKVRGSQFKVRGSQFKVRGSQFKVRGSQFKVRGGQFKVRGGQFKVRITGTSRSCIFGTGMPATFRLSRGRVGRLRFGRFAAAVAVLVASGAVRLAHSQDDAPTPVRLEFENRSGANCPDVAALAKDVVSRLGYDPFSATASDVLSVSISRAQRGLRGEVRWGAGARRGEMRALESKSDCRELARALALTMSIAIDPVRAMAPQPSPPPASDAGLAPEPSGLASASASGGPAPVSPDAGIQERAAPKPEPPPPPAEPRVEGPRSPSADRANVAPTLRLVLDVHGTVGLLPAVSAGAALAVELAFENWILWAAIRSDLPAKDQRSTGFVVGSTAFGTAGLCRRIGPAAACLFGRGGRLQGGGEGYARNGAGTSPMATIGGRAFYDVLEQHPMRLRLFLDCDIPLTHNQLRVNDSPEWEPASVAGTLGAAMVMSIP